ncbi:MAG: winged helix-turn-helix transcriptional regulator [Deltaproteobacteria bacterium]|nr:winged helix-turn-helix transcriptional regulator [Deltaproteobacteria bacterium]MBW2390739.1 winged helix-turn-helix transcriptional regulator [Deltaproteobacteria bacterium]MBW2726049.1 winged helix-turn-helix transcriptional regulator [Deltaproteobacteria bacterium]
MRPARPKEEQILLWCGVVTQLQRTRANRILADADLPYPLFILLRHFCHDPDREWTVGQLTAAFETGQPGMTKKIKKLLARRLIEGRPDAADRRVRWLRVTRAGVRLRDRLSAKLEPDQKSIFSGWKRKEIVELHRLLDRLRSQLDEQRDALVYRPADKQRSRK